MPLVINVQIIIEKMAFVWSQRCLFEHVSLFFCVWRRVFCDIFHWNHFEIEKNDISLSPHKFVLFVKSIRVPFSRSVRLRDICCSISLFQFCWFLFMIFGEFISREFNWIFDAKPESRLHNPGKLCHIKKKVHLWGPASKIKQNDQSNTTALD